MTTKRKAGYEPKVIVLDDDDVDFASRFEGRTDASDGRDEIVYDAESHFPELQTGLYRFSDELLPTIHLAPEHAHRIINRYLRPTGEQSDGDNYYQRILHDGVLDFASDGNVLIVDSDTLTSCLATRDNIRSVPKPDDTGNYVSLFGYRTSIPVTDRKTYRNILRATLCRNVYYEYRLLPSDIPIEDRALPLQYRCIAFMVPSASSNRSRSDHFATMVYYVHGRDSTAVQEYHNNYRSIGERFTGHTKRSDSTAVLYYYDSLYALNLPNATKVADLLEDMGFFSETGRVNIINVFGNEAFQEDRSCSSFSLYFAERARQEILRRNYAPLVRSDFPQRNDSICAVSLLTQTQERITSEAVWWLTTAQDSVLEQNAAQFIDARVGGLDPQRRTRLIAAFVDLLRHTDVKPMDQRHTFKETFGRADAENARNLNPDLVRLYLLTSMLVPNHVLFSTSIEDLANKWNSAIESYKQVIQAIRSDPRANVTRLSDVVPHMVLWLYLPPEDSAINNNVPLGLRLPALFVGKPTYTLGYPQASMRLCYVNLYTTTNPGLDDQLLAEGIDNDLLKNLFYSNIQNYSEDPSSAYEPDHVRFVRWYAPWRYAICDMARTLSRHDGYFDYSVPADNDAEEKRKPHSPPWSRMYTEYMKRINPEVVQNERGKNDHRDMRIHFRGKLAQLLSSHALPATSINKKSMLFNSRGIDSRVDINNESWHYRDVKPRVDDASAMTEDTASLVRTPWAFCYYNLTFHAAIYACIQQQLRTPGWGILSVPCALEVRGTRVLALLETWAVVTGSLSHTTAPMPIVINGLHVGVNSAQPVYFGLLDILRIIKSPLIGSEFATFFTNANKPTFEMYQNFSIEYGMCAGLYTPSQDPFAHVLLKDYTVERAAMIDTFVATVKASVPGIDVNTFAQDIAPYADEAAMQVAIIATAFIISKTRP